MDTRRDVEEALTIFDQLTENEKQIALARLMEMKKEKGAA